MSVILCIDPGSTLGVAVYEEGALVYYTQLGTDNKKPLWSRVAHLDDQIQVLFSKYEPTTLVVEDVLSAAYGIKHWKALLWVVITYVFATLTAHRRRMDIFQVNPKRLKKHATNNGAATKPMMIQAAETILPSGTKLKKSQHNVADAILLGAYYLDEREAA